MQTELWDDYRILLALSRSGTFAAAGAVLGVRDTTVARRLARLQAAQGAVLVRRQRDGQLVLTDRGRQLVQAAEAMERALGKQQPPPEPVVRVTAVPIIMNRVLLRFAHQVLDQHEGLTLELVPEARDLSLTRREADIALRLGRPVTGGAQVIARRLTELRYGAYVGRELTAEATERLGWITYDDSLAHLPHAAFSREAAKRAAAAAVRVQDADTAMEAAVRGLGIALLPDCVARADARLRRLDDVKAPGRDLWLLVHRNLREEAPVRAVLDWIGALDWD